MSTDIHAWIEYDPHTRAFDKSGLSFADGSIFLPRDYGIFATLAGVGAQEDETPLFTPRGVPDDICPDLFLNYYEPVTDADAAARSVRSGQSHYAPPRRRDPLVVEGYRETRGADGREGYALVSREALHPATYVSNPDYNTAGWLTPPEFTRVLETVRSSRQESVPLQWDVVGIVLNELDRRLGQANVRFVFWFDS
jgi:hypothetical protein